MKQETGKTRTYFKNRHSPMGGIRVIYEDILWVDIKMNKVKMVHMYGRWWNHLR